MKIIKIFARGIERAIIKERAGLGPTYSKFQTFFYFCGLNMQILIAQQME